MRSLFFSFFSFFGFSFHMLLNRLCLCSLKAWLCLKIQQVFMSVTLSLLLSPSLTHCKNIQIACSNIFNSFCIFFFHFFINLYLTLSVLCLSLTEELIFKKSFWYLSSHSCQIAVITNIPLHDIFLYGIWQTFLFKYHTINVQRLNWNVWNFFLIFSVRGQFKVIKKSIVLKIAKHML